MTTTDAGLTGDHVAIIGGGFSGTLLAINLMRHDGPRATLIERRPTQMARGVAYSAAHDEHLLNVRAGNMSALPDDAGHFVRWLEAKALGDARTFVSRRIYGAYLREMLDAAVVAHRERLTVIEGAVASLDRRADGVTLTREEIAERMSGNLCRCGAYNGIVEAVAETFARNEIEAEKAA